MHDMRRHAEQDPLHRASSGSSSQAKGIKEALKTTDELAKAIVGHIFNGRYITPQEPFAGQVISFVPHLTVLGPTQSFYRTTLEGAIKEDVLPIESYMSGLPGADSGAPETYASPLLAALGGTLPLPPARMKNAFSQYLGKRSSLSDLVSAYSGILENSSVEENPKTQPFNNTSVILGMQFRGSNLLFTADAGAEAMDAIPLQWKNLTWMQVPHHGSDGNLSKTNIERFRPKAAFISARGSANHPSRAIVNALIKVGATVLSTVCVTRLGMFHTAQNTYALS
jgi:hypothetical protein